MLGGGCFPRITSQELLDAREALIKEELGDTDGMGWTERFHAEREATRRAEQRIFDLLRS